MSEDDTADDDWFERALREDDVGTPSGADQDVAGADDPATADTESDADAATDDPDGFEGGFESASDIAEAGGGDALVDDSESTSGAAENAFGDTGAESQFEAAGSPADAFDDPSAGDGLFETDFGEAMGSTGGETDFADDDIDSAIPRIDLGIEGLDNMVQGGIPNRHLMVVIGGAGTGKTTFGLQFIQHGLEKDDTDKGVFITLEQTHDAILSTANEHGWDFERHEDEDNLAIIDLDPIEMANSLDNIQGELPTLIEEFDADRFVLDSVSLLEMMYDDVATRRTEVFDFTQSLKSAGVTTVLTSEANEDNPYTSRHGIIEYLTDAVFLLRYVRSETRETRLAVEIQKIRNANHSREAKPYDITEAGISVYEQANIF